MAFLSLLQIGEIQLYHKAYQAIFQTQKPGEVPFSVERLRIS